MDRWRRLLLLLACLFAGALVAVVGHGLSGSSAWALALPLALAIGWWAVADPTACIPSNESKEEGRR